MKSGDESDRVREILKMFRASVVIFLSLFLSEKYENKLPYTGILSPSTIVFLIGFGYLHVRYNDILAYLYNLNRFASRTTPQTNKIVGVVVLIAAGAYCIGLFMIRMHWLR